MKDWTRLLLSVLPPPEEVSPRWRIPAGDDATAYPGDYLELMGLYGPGCVDDFLCLLAPQHPNENLDAHRLGPAWVKGIEELAGTVGERLPPEVEDFGDLVAWAGTDNGDMCFRCCSSPSARKTGTPNSISASIVMPRTNRAMPAIRGWIPARTAAGGL